MRTIFSRPTRALAATLIAAGCLTVAGVGIEAQSASAAPSCQSGFVCMWTGTGGGGTKYSYGYAADHTHRVASVFYDYNSSRISFYSAKGGLGRKITHYTLAERGFRNWTSNNWDDCKSHRDTCWRSLL